VGERFYYVATDADGDWVAVLVFSAAANHLKHRDHWIRWSEAQRRRRLRLLTNNARFLLLPDRTEPNLGSRVLRLTLERLSQDWQAHYGHPVLVVETFVDPDQFDGTVYSAHGWIELGPTDGWGRHARDFYVPHDKPKRLFVRELRPQATRALQAEHLQPALAAGETPVALRCSHSAQQIGSIVDQFQSLPQYRQRIESYPRFSLATIILLAMLCKEPRGQTDLEKFARGLSQPNGGRWHERLGSVHRRGPERVRSGRRLHSGHQPHRHVATVRSDRQQPGEHLRGRTLL